MKKWSGGVMIMALAMILIFSFSLVGKQPQKQSTYNFFHYHPENDSLTRDSGFIMPSNSEVKVKTVPKPSTKLSTKPHLVNVEGLSLLYDSHNISQGDSKPLLVWAYMRPLLSRSDALSETAQGVKEASVAWTDLMSTIEEQKASEFNNSESKPPVILHYNVNLPGDNMTEEPFIVENTWNAELGWGKEERCPAHRSANNVRVDSLVLCNEQFVRSSSEENVNASHPSSDMMTNVSKGSDHGTASFPFVEGTPFTASLWVGLEGFHMTVNGRHETSFAYREKLEPWSVSRVKVAGGLNLLSALAKALPVSEDHDLVVDVDNLKAPSIQKKRLVMLIGVFSSGNNFERRMALRRSWMQYGVVRAGKVAVRFFIGLHKNKQVNYELWREAQAYGDIQLMPFVDYYSLISLKTIAICIMGTKVFPAKYIMKTDDDAFVRIDEVLSSLKEKPSNGLLYGLISLESSPIREKDSKWYISKEEWPHASYPPWAHGPGYIISRDIAKFIAHGHQERDLQLFKLEDVAMGIWIEQFKNSGQEVHYINDGRFYNAGCESNYVLAHYQSPRLVLCLWEKLQREQKPNCCE
ncbi:hypothetical protein FNV43_RR01069 [Rhamnella rubrinervis]|uniref:Galectin domain-containing protein n=1 Tax=Rhamnella rubrinervis TaxID=2594499 RepID=A0A8K0HRX2_9ROSA|nr:hypothetical protein FNV43_RR01069 [Rhamnella rubrinervis]